WSCYWTSSRTSATSTRSTIRCCSNISRRYARPSRSTCTDSSRTDQARRTTMLSLIAKFNNKQEARESKDEILIGEIVFAMAHMGCPTIGFNATAGQQYVKFKPAGDTVMNSFTVMLDRMTGDSALQQAVIGSKTTVRIVAEVNIHIAAPDDLVLVLRTDIGNLLRSPWLADVKLDHQLNAGAATKNHFTDIASYTGMTQQSRQQRNHLLSST